MKRRLFVLSSFTLLVSFVILALGLLVSDGARAAGNIVLEFDGLSRNAINDFTQTPDMSGAVGLNHYVQAVNLQIRMFDKETGVASGLPVNLVDFFSGNNSCGSVAGLNLIGQPQVLYDHMSQRWFVAAAAYVNIDNGPYYQCIAMSQSEDPTLQWSQYAIPIHPDYLHDQPKFGLWPDGIYMAADLYDVWNNGLHRTPKGVTVWAFNRDDLVAGNPTPATQSFYISESFGYSGLLPGNLLGAPPPNGTPNYFAAINPPNQFLTWEFHVDWINTSSSTFVGPKTTTVNNFTPVVGYLAPQWDNTENLDIVGQRLMPPLQYRYMVNGTATPALWANHTVGNGSTVGVRWYEMRNLGAASHTVYQQGTFSNPADSAYRWLGSLAVDKGGNMALAYSKSSPYMFPAIYQTGRLASDPLGQLMVPEELFQLGSGGQDIDPLNEGPWGSYSSMSLDPYDECHFWYTNQYYVGGAPTVWRTWITKFSLVECDPVNPGIVRRVSLHTNDTQALGGGSGIYGTAVSANGRYVVFESEANNLVDGDTNGHVDVFLRDRDADGDGIYDEPGSVTTTRVSRGYLGDQANGDSGVGVTGDFGGSSLSISADGRYIAFSSAASNLVVNDTNGTTDVFVYDRTNGKTVRVSVSSSGGQGGAVSDQPSLSANGRFVAFRSYASNLIGNDTNALADIFLHDRDTNGNGIFDEPGSISTIRVSVSSAGGQSSGGHSYTPAISPSNNGRFIAFTSDAANLVGGDGNGLSDIFVHDRDADGDGIMDEAGQTITYRASVNSIGVEANGRSYNPSISANGQRITFASQAANLDVNLGATSGRSQIFVHQTSTFTTHLVSAAMNTTPPIEGNKESYRPVISHDGTHIAFESVSSNFIPGDPNGLRDIYVARLNADLINDPVTADMWRASFGYNNTPANGHSFWPAINNSGQHVVYASNANNLVSNDTNNLRDVFAHDHAAIRSPGPVLSIPQGQIPKVYAGEEVAVPIRFTSNGHAISSIAFALDLTDPCWLFDKTDSNTDGMPDDVTFTLPAGFWKIVSYDAANLSLEITAYGSPPTALPDSNIVSVKLTAACQPDLGGSQFHTVRFSHNPAASFGSTAGQNIPGTTQNGSVEVLFNNIGDCNGDTTVNAADISSLVLEIFDGDGQIASNVPGGTFPGNPRGCNANQDTVVDSADITCTVLIIFNGIGACNNPPIVIQGGQATPFSSSMVALDTQAVSLAIPDLIQTLPGQPVTVPVNFSTSSDAVSSLVFSIDFDESRLGFDPADGNSDGLPDAISLNVPAGFVTAVTFDANDSDGEIDVVIYDLAPPMASVPGGTLLTINFTAVNAPNTVIAPVTFSLDPVASFGSTTGQSVANSTDNGSVLIGMLNEKIYLPVVLK